jgi:hypothetical protein
MLTQLSQLKLSTDGRYATAEELQFFKNYLSTATQRVETYRKIRDNEAFLIEDVYEQTKSVNPGLFLKGNRDVSSTAKRDCKNIFRILTTAMLFDDLDFLREGALLWHRTIVRSFGIEEVTQVTWQTMPKVINKYLAAEEAKLLSPGLGLTKAILR